MEFSEIIDFLSNEESNWSSRGHEEVTLPFDVTPSEYLSFAEYDLELGVEKHKFINALSNAKRSLDCQIDSLLIAFDLYDLAKRKNWNIPKKLETLKLLGILAPRILNKINSVRNLMEHEFIVPQEEQVTDFIDIVALFLASTERHLFDFPIDSQIEGDDQKISFIDVRFKRDINTIEIYAILEETREKVDFLIDNNHPEYIRFIANYIKKFARN